MVNVHLLEAKKQGLFIGGVGYDAVGKWVSICRIVSG